MQALKCAEGVVAPALGAAARLGRWFVVVRFLPLSGVCQLRNSRSPATVHRALPLCKWPGLGMPLGTARSNTAFARATGVVEPALGAEARLLGR